MITEKLKNDVRTVLATLEEEGMMSVGELVYYTNLEEQDIMQVLAWLNEEKKVYLSSEKKRDCHVMLIY
ncbi:MAG: hypothetical protein A2W90_16195 [Bacteroidetes bacterium GWF2_42_66]|nr:MAG: hypothetical protein A2W92_08875 [Bacteroidetes bacterium GWA2_42_15]OFX96240.1 MAG: hypothetical protein A2W89_05125 [Bacteroidetes bacterium GWE2_42_39]OFY46279.1 MAG: hypothetical protein A2W90_16195 [Bacteroidetes bacterium GWF2_42_66]HAZ02604.1 hypothetical protein [Marinilabiliales bacterium]HBL78344.1 hypothetical protein [Prolixibacteraceae bacterium]